MSKSNNTRRIHQADYQRAYRAEQKALRKPTRDDVARLALHLMINGWLQDGDDAKLAEWCKTIVARLGEQGFEKDATYHRLDELIERYAQGWSFQRKTHLMAEP
jgi:hypothetical protein